MLENIETDANSDQETAVFNELLQDLRAVRDFSAYIIGSCSIPIIAPMGPKGGPSAHPQQYLKFSFPFVIYWVVRPKTLNPIFQGEIHNNKVIKVSMHFYQDTKITLNELE